MWIVLSGIIGVAALLGTAPMAMAGELPSNISTGASATSHTSADSQAGPQNGVSLLAVLLTAGGAVAAAGSGVALAVTRRRGIDRP
jgi:hypothetical protein